MNNMVMRNQIRKTATGLREVISAESYMNCGHINERIKTGLEREYNELELELIHVTVTPVKRCTMGEEHCMIKISQSTIEDESDDVYVDGALDQFCKENEHMTGVTLPSCDGERAASRSEFDIVEVFTWAERSSWRPYVKSMQI